MSEDKTVNTFVFHGEIPKDKNFFCEKFMGAECTAWHSGDALGEKWKLEEFIRNLSCGEFEDPQDAAVALMDSMGWG